jgi:hypothetical protein
MQLPSKGTTYWILMAAAGLALLLPRTWSSSVSSFFHSLALLQWPLASLARETGAQVEHWGEDGLSGEAAATLRAENEALQRQVFQQRLALEEAERRLTEVTGFAGQLPDKHVGIIIAPVVGYDADPRRASLRILLSWEESQRLGEVWEPQARARGADGAWVVAAGSEPITAPEWDPNATLADLVRRGWAVGRVVELAPYVARVQVTTDPAAQFEVLAARFGREGAVEYASTVGERLVGRGGGRMLIDQARQDYYRTGYRLIVIPPDRQVPLPLLVGVVTQATARNDSSQHFDLEVVPPGVVGRLSHVYVIVPGR